MTENEATRELKSIKSFMKNHGRTTGCDFLESEYGALSMAIQALEEIKQYRAIGTVEELKSMKENGAFTGVELANIAAGMMKLKEYQAIGTVEEFKALKENCIEPSSLRLYLTQLEKYRAIGTIEEFKALKEKNTPKELSEHNFQDEPHHYLCPNCRSIVSCNQNYCEECGQALET